MVGEFYLWKYSKYCLLNRIQDRIWWPYFQLLSSSFFFVEFIKNFHFDVIVKIKQPHDYWVLLVLLLLYTFGRMLSVALYVGSIYFVKRNWQHQAFLFRHVLRQECELIDIRQIDFGFEIFLGQSRGISIFEFAGHVVVFQYLSAHNDDSIVGSEPRYAFFLASSGMIIKQSSQKQFYLIFLCHNISN